ncbi:MAG: transglycosylase SLT domain-containing protein [Candidatus Latescibacteria bacterium]|nr:transglycosylase SLT domain-containing protein [Candidatus Latescibacterota bacterium]
MQDTNAVIVRPDPPIRPGSLSKADTLRLKEAVQGFESLLVAYMLKAMRETINRPEDERGLGREYYENLFDSEVATNLSRTQGFGLAAALYRQLTGESMEEEKTVIPQPLTPITPPPDRPLSSIVHQPAGAIHHSDDGSRFTEDTLTGRGNDTLPLPTARLGSAVDRVNRYAPIVHAAAQRYNLDPDLLRAVILAESNGWARAVSPKGALGLMQLMPETADTLDVKDPMDPHQNIFGGARYLRSLLDTFTEDIRLALASYNAGPGVVREHRGVPPYEETRTFIDRVLDHLERLRKSK